VESHGTGFYSVTEFKALLEDARRKGITIIPELGAPGHSKAAITGTFQAEVLKMVQKSKKVQKVKRYKRKKVPKTEKNFFFIRSFLQ
jgi:N-acetyl-beta-hexosaminidase